MVFFFFEGEHEHVSGGRADMDGNRVSEGDSVLTAESRCGA